MGAHEQPIILDCWAGNQGLRDFYHRAAFRLLGVVPVPADGWEVAVFVSAPPLRPSGRAPLRHPTAHCLRRTINDLIARATGPARRR